MSRTSIATAFRTARRRWEQVAAAIGIAGRAVVEGAGVEDGGGAAVVAAGVDPAAAADRAAGMAGHGGNERHDSRSATDYADKRRVKLRVKGRD